MEGDRFLTSPQANSTQTLIPDKTSQDLTTQDPAQLSPQQAMSVFTSDPVGFIQQLIEQAASKHLWNMKEQAELTGALNVMRNANPEFKMFEPAIMQEVPIILNADPSAGQD